MECLWNNQHNIYIYSIIFPCYVPIPFFFLRLCLFTHFSLYMSLYTSCPSTSFSIMAGLQLNTILLVSNKSTLSLLSATQCWRSEKQFVTSMCWNSTWVYKRHQHVSSVMHGNRAVYNSCSYYTQQPSSFCLH